MDIGMLWYDDDGKRQLDEKVARAVEFYRAKYGVQPTDCYVHPGMLGDGQPRPSEGSIQPSGIVFAAGVRVRPNRTVIKNHFWLGVGEAAETQTARKVKA
jgi:hypothetical protein